MAAENRLIRRGTPEDAPWLAPLAERIFREAFAATNDAAEMDRYCSEAFSEEALRAELTSPLASFLVAFQGTRPAGYSQLQLGEVPVCVTGPAPVQLKRIYVLSEFHGSGLARSLFARAITAARELHARTMWLTVWEQNARAIRFYERAGMAAVGDAEFLLGTEVQRDLVMAAPLDELRP